MSALQRESIVITGPVGELEGVLECEVEHPAFIAAVCHPHPLYQGTMNNKVVTTLQRAYREMGGAVMRFNYRGVGQSQGSYGNGDGEAEDLLAVVTWLRERYPNIPLRLAGFSFGTYVAASGAYQLAEQGQAAEHLLLVAPSVVNFDFSPFQRTSCPVLVIQGEEDEVVSPQAVFSWVAKSPLMPTVLRLNAGHFFHGQLVELAELIHLSRHPLVQN